MLRIAVVLSLGIILASRTAVHPAMYLFILLICLMMVWFISAKLSLKARQIFGASILVSIGLVGSALYTAQLPANQPGHFSHFVNSNNYYKVQLLSVNNRQAVLSFHRANEHPCFGKILAYMPPGYMLGEDDLFDYFIAKIHIRQLQPMRNPTGFNRLSYYHTREIYHEGNIISWHRLTADPGLSMRLQLRDLREKAKAILHRALLDENEYAVAAALLLGDKSDLLSDLKSAFSDTGSMHVLAVSGMHLGVLYMALVFIFSRLGRKWKFFKLLVILMALWFFAFLVGGSSSVMRAALMFSMLLIGEALSRRSSTINSISAAAVLLLLTDPNSLFDVGFQLSFAAVFGIVLLQRPIERLWIIKNTFALKIWQLITVSIAAQLFTLPFALYYFHIFPMYFWLSGIIVVPLAVLILIVGLPFLIFHTLPVLGWILSKILYALLWCLNSTVMTIRNLPGVRLEGFWPDMVQLILLSLIIFCITVLLVRRQIRMLLWIGCFLLAMQVYGLVKSFHQCNAGLLICYFFSGKSGGDVILRNRAFPMGALAASGDTTLYGYRDFRASHNVTTVDYGTDKIPILFRPPYFAIGDFYFARPQIPLPFIIPYLDLIWISDESTAEAWTTKASSSKTEVVLDGGMTFQQAFQAENKFKKLGYKVHNVWEDGAYIRKFKVK